MAEGHYRQLPQSRAAYSRALAAVLACLIAGCGTTRLVVREPIPKPVMHQLPLQVGLLLPESLVSRVEKHTTPSGDQWAIELGAANEALFRRVFGAMFASVTPVADVDTAAVDLVLRPRLVDFQFSTPGTGGSRFFEAWVSYDIGVYAPNTGRIASLPIHAYGRSPNPMLGDDEALRQAIKRALRDAATALVLKLPDKPFLQPRQARSKSSSITGRQP